MRTRRQKVNLKQKRGLLIGERIENIVPGVTDDFAKEEGARYGEVNYKSGNAYKIFKIESFPVKEDIRKR